MVDPLSPDAVYEVISYLDAKMRSGNFTDVDNFLSETKIEQITNPAYLLAICGYIQLAKERGDVLVNGPSFRERAFMRLRALVGNERAENLMKTR